MSIHVNIFVPLSLPSLNSPSARIQTINCSRLVCMPRDTTPEKQAKRPKEKREGERVRHREPEPERPPTREQGPVVVKTTNVAGAGPYPSINTVAQTVVALSPSAPPQSVGAQSSRDPPREQRRPVSEEEREAKPERQEKKKHKSEKKEKKERVSKADQAAVEVRRIREKEAMGITSKPERANAGETVRRQNQRSHRKPHRRGVEDVSYLAYVDWRCEGYSKVSLLIWLGILAIVALLALVWISPTVAHVNLTATTSTSFVLNSTIFEGSTVTSGPNVNGTTKALPSLVKELLALPNAPDMYCKDPAFNETAALAKYQVANPHGQTIPPALAAGADIDLTGTFCSKSQFRVGYCVAADTCDTINDLVAGTNTTLYKICSEPVGPRRSDLRFIPNSFVELVSAYVYIPLVALIPALLLGAVWMSVSLSSPVKSPFVLSGIAVIVNAIVYVVWTVVMSDRSNNFYILIYAGVIAAFVALTRTYHLRVGRNLRVGNLVLSGRPVEENTQMLVKSSSTIANPVFAIACMHTALSYGLLVFAAGAQLVVYLSVVDLGTSKYSNAQRWLNWINGILDSGSIHFGNVDVGAADIVYPASPLMDCAFTGILGFGTAITVFAVFYFFVSIFFEFAAKFVVSKSVADWYFAGTAKYAPPTSGSSGAGMESFVRALFCGGWRIVSNGFWAALADSGPILTGSPVQVLLFLIVSPIDCLFYGLVAVLLSNFAQEQSRFGLVHSAMSTTASVNISNRASHSLVGKTYGRVACKPGDSPEMRLLTTSGNLLAVGCGLAVWLWCDSVQGTDSVTTLGPWILLVLWLAGSAVQRPGLLAMAALITDVSLAPSVSLDQHMARNGLIGFLLTAAMSAAIIRIFLEVPTSATDATVYCFAIERRKRTHIRSLELDTRVYQDYLGQTQKVPPGHILDKIVVECPPAHKPGQMLAIDFNGKQYQVEVPPGAKAGRDFEATISIPLNSLDMDEPESPSDEEERNPNVIRNLAPTSPYGEDRNVNAIRNLSPTPPLSPRAPVGMTARMEPGTFIIPQTNDTQYQ